MLSMASPGLSLGFSLIRIRLLSILESGFIKQVRSGSMSWLDFIHSGSGPRFYQASPCPDTGPRPDFNNVLS